MNGKWFKITCPNCGKVYNCKFFGIISEHCYLYVTQDSKKIVGLLETGELECPRCHTMFIDE